MNNDIKDYATASSLSLDEIPVIDLEPLLQRQEVNDVAQKLMAAALHCGFFYVKNHGIQQEVIHSAMDASKAFFQLSHEEKAKVAVNQQQRGWLAPGMAQFSDAKTHDLKEIFFYGPEKWSPAMESKRHEIPLITNNQWPEQCADLQKDVVSYYEAVCQLGHTVLSAIAVGMEEVPDFFKKYYTSPLGRGQLVYYPPSGKGDEEQERFGAAPHTDFGVLTLLYQDNSGGLQVLNTSKEWVEAPPISGTFVCNIGDLLKRWTNNHLSSNLHRVINRSGNARFSMPIFFDPDPDAVIDSKNFTSLEDHEQMYPAIQVSDYIDSKNRKTFAHYKERFD